MSGFALAQAFSFARNALLGHWLSPSDFGIAATLTMMLQLIELLTDVGADRLIVQAKDGNRPLLLANAHLLLIGRGALTALTLYLAAGPIARILCRRSRQGGLRGLGARAAYPGLLHLDCRRAQRRFDNRPNMLIEVVPQAVSAPAGAARGQIRRHLLGDRVAGLRTVGRCGRSSRMPSPSGAIASLRTGRC